MGKMTCADADVITAVENAILARRSFTLVTPKKTSIYATRLTDADMWEVDVRTKSMDMVMDTCCRDIFVSRYPDTVQEFGFALMLTSDDGRPSEFTPDIIVARGAAVTVEVPPTDDAQEERA